MTPCGTWKSHCLAALVAIHLGGCATRSPMPPGALIDRPASAPILPPPRPPANLPEAPRGRRAEKSFRPIIVVYDPTAVCNGTLQLADVLRSVDAHFPLLLAVQQERAIAEGLKLSAEGQFDPIMRVRTSEQVGTFANGRLDFGVEQPIGAGGVNTFAGWRLGQGNFPIYYGDRKTADGGEFRAGATLPLLQNRTIDPRRARLRAAQIQEQMADPLIQRARLDYLRSAAQAYWAWQTAGAQYLVAQRLADLAAKRQEVVDVRQRAELIAASVPALNRRLVASRMEAQLAAERTLQQASLRLSLFLRDANGDPLMPSSEWLRADFLDMAISPPNAQMIQADVAAALQQRPELVRFQLEKERRANELQLAINQELPTLNAFVAAAQDVGGAKKTFTGQGPFDTDRTNAEVGATFEAPLPRRDARGRIRTAQAQLSQLLAQERYARDEIAAQVQDALSELVQTAKRLQQAKEELRQATRVLEIETTLFEKQQTTLVELNIQETAAAEAQ